MKKTLLLLLALGGGILTAFSAEDLGLSDLGSGWESSYDASTKTITYEGAYKGRGWYYSTPKDISANPVIVIEFDDMPIGIKIVCEGTTSGVSMSKDFSAGASRIALDVSEFSEKNSVRQIYLQNHATGSVVLKSAKLLTTAEYETLRGERTTATLNLAAMNQNWGSSDGDTYDAETHIADYTVAGYKGFGWYVNNDSYKDYKSVVFLFEPTPIGTIVKVTGKDNEDNDKSVEVYPSAGSVYGIANIEGFKTITNIMLQNNNVAGKVRIKDAYVSNLAISDETTYVTSHDFPLVTSLGFASYVTGRAVDFTGTGLKAYIATAITKEDGVSLEEVTKVPANTPLIIEGASDCYELAATTETTEDVSANKLISSDGSIAGSNLKYVLGKSGSSPVFQPTAGLSAIPKGKAYLEVPSALTAPKLSINFGGDDGTTGIENLKIGSDDNVYYNLKGQRVVAPTKGIYIVNGKKIIVK